MDFVVSLEEYEKMVRVCAFPNCSNQMKKYLSLSFHRLPLHNREIVQLWLVALQLDVQTPLKTLRERDYRVCSEHFDEDDFTENSVKNQYLKSTAIPKAKKPAGDNFEGKTSSDIEKELAAVPQSTPKKTSSKSDQSSSFKIVLSSPQTTIQQRRTKPSLSGISFLQSPLWQQTDLSATTSSPSFTLSCTTIEDVSQEQGAAVSLTEPHTASVDVSQGCTENPDVLEMSTSLGEMALQDPSDTSYTISSETTTPSKECVSDSDSSSANGKGWSERKWLVNEVKLLELFALCRTCGSAIEDKKIFTHSSQIRIQWNCINDHSGIWSSCSDIRGMAASNLIISAAIYFTGTTHSTIMDWAELLHTSIPKKSQFYAVQSTYLIPVIQEAYQTHHEQIMERLIELSNSGQKVDLCGDARCDSPGFSAKYCTYSFMENVTKEIVHFEFVQVTEANSSVAMEVMGFQRGLDYLLERGVVIGVITTDRSPSIRKLLRDNYSCIRHELDPWHVSKSVKKKLVSISNKTDNKDLRPWIKAIINHLYWSCYTSKGDREECVRIWTSLLHHIRGVHRWEEDGVQYTCSHPTLTEEQQRRKRWLKSNSSAFLALKGVVMDSNLLRDLRQMALFKHTGSLEVFHSVMLKYAEKRLHFNYDSMRARTQLAVLDHNSNLGRPLATTQQGQPKHKVVYSRQSQQWVAKPMYERTNQAFRDDLMERVWRRREDSTIVFSESLPRHRQRRRRLLHNIAPFPRPDKSDLVAQARLRYMSMF